jgi:hypothetical protein
MKAPFPWFGGKRQVAPIVWQRFGDVPNYVEPFFGSGAVLLNRPHEPRIETVNDKDAYLANFWRALKTDPEQVAHYANWPVNENDLHARHIWLVNRKNDLVSQIEGDPDYFDVRIAGWWVWGMACWIGGEFCSGNGPWGSVNGKLVHLGDAGHGINRKRVHLGDAGHGVHRRRVHIGDAGQGVNRKLVHIGDTGRGVQRRRVHLHVGQGDAGSGEQGLCAWFEVLAKRLERVRVCCGDWQRVCGPSPTTRQGLTGLFFDPPYSSEAERDKNIYSEENLTVAHDVREYCIKHGSNPLLHIALCGYVGEHESLAEYGWTPYYWTAPGGMAHTGNAKGKENRKREVIWFSPHCLNDEVNCQLIMFEEEE